MKKYIKKIFQFFGLEIRKYRKTPGHLDWLKELGIKTVLDIGANIGQFATEISGILPEATIYSFEPIKECFKKLNENMASNSNFKSFNFALGDKEENVEMNKSSYTPSSSILKMADAHKELFPHTKDSVKETIKIKTLDGFSKSQNFEKEILLKIDVQGYEDKVISGGKKVFSIAKVVIIETSFTALYENQPLFDQIYEILKTLGFSYTGCSEQKLNKLNGKVILEDSVFIRERN